MDNVFINEAFESSINAYIKLETEYNEVIANSFSIIVLKLLSSIYGETDITNPFIIKNEESFKQNLTKFGYSVEEYEEFKSNFLEYYKIEEENQSLELKKDNPYFVKIQKQLIDMFFKKRNSYSVSLNEESEFFDLLYTTKTTNPLRASYNYLTAKNIKEVETYYYGKVDEEAEKIETPQKSNVLNLEAYEILNYSLTDIANMDASSVDKINENVYNFFEISEEADNKIDLLNEAIENYKKYNSRLTSGNGYVDILLVMGVVVTGVLLLAIATLVIL